jgi:hypothetical protein
MSIRQTSNSAIPQRIKAATRVNNIIGTTPKVNKEVPKTWGRNAKDREESFLERTTIIRIIPTTITTTARTLNNNEMICKAG